MFRSFLIGAASYGFRLEKTKNKELGKYLY